MTRPTRLSRGIEIFRLSGASSTPRNGSVGAQDTSPQAVHQKTLKQPSHLRFYGNVRTQHGRDVARDGPASSLCTSAK